MIVKSPEEAQERLVGILQQTIQNVADKVLESVVDKTPVQSGEAQDGWRQEVISPEVIQVINDVPYIGVLEHGNDNHTAHNMVADTLSDAERIINDSIPNG